MEDSATETGYSSIRVFRNASATPVSMPTSMMMEDGISPRNYPTQQSSGNRTFSIEALIPTQSASHHQPHRSQAAPTMFYKSNVAQKPSAGKSDFCLDQVIDIMKQATGILANLSNESSGSSDSSSTMSAGTNSQKKYNELPPLVKEEDDDSLSRFSSIRSESPSSVDFSSSSESEDGERDETEPTKNEEPTYHLDENCAEEILKRENIAASHEEQAADVEIGGCGSSETEVPGKVHYSTTETAESRKATKGSRPLSRRVARLQNRLQTAIKHGNQQLISSISTLLDEAIVLDTWERFIRRKERHQESVQKWLTKRGVQRSVGAASPLWRDRLRKRLP